ncbi:MAG: ATP-grasp domain-containing protein [Burkholderiales bacterium]|nr:ATP-grasp domain-containing protein [Burkholderiales bacterium]
MSANNLPPCVVLGVESQIGLSLVRELGQAGVRVIAVSHQPTALGLASRHVWRRLVAGPPRSEALLAALRALGEELGPVALMTVSEANIAWLLRQRAALGSLVPVLPDPEALAVVLDKQRTLAAARAVGIDVPRSEEPRSLAEVEALAGDFPLPAVAKWKDANAVAPRLEAAGMEMVKAEYIDDVAALRAWGQRHDTLGEWPLLQQYCPGMGLGQFFFMHQGEALRRFQHLRVAEWPPEGGFSSVCDAVPLDQHVELQQRSIALLRAIGWQGVAMVEYRWDPATGRAMLMEINGRFWGSLPLALHAGAGFAELAYRSALGLPMRALPAPRGDLRCRMVATEVKRLARILLAPGRIQDRHFRVRPLAELWRFVADYFRPRVRYYLWSWDDPAPFWADLKNVLMRR